MNISAAARATAALIVLLVVCTGIGANWMTAYAVLVLTILLAIIVCVLALAIFALVGVWRFFYKLFDR